MLTLASNYRKGRRFRKTITWWLTEIMWPRRATSRRSSPVCEERRNLIIISIQIKDIFSDVVDDMFEQNDPVSSQRESSWGPAASVLLSGRTDDGFKHIFLFFCFFLGKVDGCKVRTYWQWLESARRVLNIHEHLSAARRDGVLPHAARWGNLRQWVCVCVCACVLLTCVKCGVANGGRKKKLSELAAHYVF